MAIPSTLAEIIVKFVLGVQIKKRVNWMMKRRDDMMFVEKPTKKKDDPFVEYIERKIKENTAKRDVIVLPKLDWKDKVMVTGYFTELRAWYCHQTRIDTYGDALVQHRLTEMDKDDEPTMADVLGARKEARNEIKKEYEAVCTRLDWKVESLSEYNANHLEAFDVFLQKASESVGKKGSCQSMPSSDKPLDALEKERACDHTARTMKAGSGVWVCDECGEAHDWEKPDKELKEAAARFAKSKPHPTYEWKKRHREVKP